MSGIKKMNLPAAACVGALAAMLLTALLCVPVSALIDHGVLPMSLLPIAAACAAGLSVWIAAAALLGIRKKQAMPMAAAIAGIYLLAALLCALVSGSNAVGASMTRLLIAAPAGALLALLMSIRRNSHKKRRR